MNVVGRVGSLISQGVYSVATPFHPFGGAVDVIVVQHEDGTYRSTPWYVRFGKFQGVLKGAEKVVSISVNGVEAPFHMYLDNSGQAYFTREIMPQPTEYVRTTDSVEKVWGSEEVMDQVTEESTKQTDSSDEQGYSFQMSTQSSSSYQFGSLEEVEERVKESNDSNSEVVLVSIDGHILTAPLNSAEAEAAASDSLELDHPRFHLGPGESAGGDFSGEFGGGDDVWENGIFDLDVSGNKTEGAKMENNNDRAVVVDEANNVTTRESTKLSLDKIEQFKSCIDLTAQMEGTDLGENYSPVTDNTNDNDVKSKELKEDICDSESFRMDSSVEKQSIDDSGYSNFTATFESRYVENIENEFAEKSLETGFTGEHQYPVITGNGKETENSASGVTEDPRNEHELDPENDATQMNPDIGFTGEHIDTEATGKNDGTENSARNEEENDLENEVNENNMESGFITEEHLENRATKEEEHHSPVCTGIDETENSLSGLTEGTGNEEELDRTSHTESLKFSGLGCEISTCGNMLRPGIGRTSAEEIFDSHRISEEEFRSSGPSIIKNSNLIVKIDNNYFPWSKAVHIVLGRAVYGSKFSLELKDAIPVEEREDTIGISPSSLSKRWRLWPIPFRMSRSLQRTDSTSSSADELFLDSESFLQSPTDDKPSEFGSGNGSSSNNKNNSSMSNNDNNNGASPTPRKQFVRTNTPTNEQIASLNLKEGQNMVSFSFSTRVLGRQEVDAHIYLWKWNARIVISDVDGTITKSDVLGQFMPLVGKDWTQSGVARLFCAIKENGYQLLFLSARAIVQAYLTRNFLLNLKQDGKALPSGPVVISPDGLFPSLYREVIRRAPHEFKIACLEDIKALFPSDYNPFYAGFGNRDTDELSYRKIGIPKGKIFIINPKGEVAINNCTDVKSYTSLHTLVNDMFPPTSLVEQEDYNAWNYWKTPLPDID